MKLISSFACIAFLTLSACGETEPPVPKELSQLDINSAKRQCVNVAVLQQVPQEAASDICGCTVDDLIKAGEFSATAAPTDQQQQQALDKCIESFVPSE